jgi:hypothetical protein
MLYDPFRRDFIDEEYRGKEGDGSAVWDGFANMAEQFRFYFRIVGVTAVFISLRLIKYLNRFLRVYLIIRALKSAKSDILYFFMLLLGIILAFILYGYFMLGNKMKT